MKNTKTKLKQRLNSYGKAAAALIVLGGVGVADVDAQIDHKDYDPDISLSKGGGSNVTVKTDMPLGATANISVGKLHLYYDGSYSVGIVVLEKSLQFLKNGNYAKALSVDATINDAQSFKAACAFIFGKNGSGDLQGQGVKYVGFRFKNDGTNWNYGWLKIEVVDGSKGVTVYESAYESTHSTSIKAGEVPVLSTPGLWKTDAATTVWNTATNWDDGVVPLAGVDVVIPTGTTNQPSIGDLTTAVCKSITIETGSTLTIGAGKLTVAGNWSNSGTFTAGTGTVEFGGSAEQTIGGSTTFKNLIINNTHATEKVDASGATSCNVTGSLNVTDGVFKSK